MIKGRFENIRVIVTGGSRGIGAACVRRFAEEGARVAFIYRNSEKEAEELARLTGARPVRGDLSDSASSANAMSEAMDIIGGIDVLVNNAGIAQFKLFDAITDGEWDRMIETDLGGVFRASRAAVPKMLSQKSGVIINISSMWGQVGASCEAAYSATKGAVIALTKSLAKELGPSHIRVNCVSPGLILTDMCASLSPDTLETLREETPLGRHGTPEDVAQALVYLSGAEFVTGQVLPVNGGFLI